MHLQVVYIHNLILPYTLEFPSFSEDPSNVTAASGDPISLNCTTTGVPLPTVIWEENKTGSSITDDEVYSITILAAENGTVISVLEFVAFDGVNGSQFHCLAENRAGQSGSELATIIIGGEMERDTYLFSKTSMVGHQYFSLSPPSPPLILAPLPPLFPLPLTGVPLPPNPTVDTITSRTALVSWPPPFSILPVTQYIITWIRVDTGERDSTTIDADMTQLLLTDLRPNWMYSVTVVSVNRVGPSLPPDPVVFTTAEDGKSEFWVHASLFVLRVIQKHDCDSCIQVTLLPHPVQHQRHPQPTSPPPRPNVMRLTSPGILLPWSFKMGLSLTTMSAMWLREEPRQNSVFPPPSPPLP